MRRMKWIGTVVAALLLSGCGTLSGKLDDATDAQLDSIVERIANAIEPRIEQLVDSQIEREERALGIWGTTNSYFYAEQSAQKTEIRAEAEALVASTADELLKQIDRLIDNKLRK